MRKASIIRFPQRKVGERRSDGMRDLIRGGVPLAQHNKRIPGAQRVPSPQTLRVRDGCGGANPPPRRSCFPSCFCLTDFHHHADTHEDDSLTCANFLLTSAVANDDPELI